MKKDDDVKIDDEDESEYSDICSQSEKRKFAHFIKLNSLKCAIYSHCVGS